jgi:predicted DNA-binding transcriptional regulator YafY
VYLFIKLKPSRLEQEYRAHAEAREKASRRILDNEKNLDKVFSKPSQTKLTAAKPVSEKTPVTNKNTKKKKAISHTSSVELDICYEDAKGVITRRKIRVMKYDKSSQTVMAWCHRRNALRCFYICRMIEAVDTKTGEVIDDVGDYLLMH